MSLTVRGNTGAVSENIVVDSTVKVAQNNFVNTSEKTKASIPVQPKRAPSNATSRSSDSTKKNELRGTRVRGNRADAKISSQKVTQIILFKI